MELWLTVNGLIKTDGFISATYPKQVGVKVSDGKITDIEHGEGFEYTLADDGLIDWAGNEIELNSRSMERLKTALA